jgi:hypothetical protein
MTVEEAKRVLDQWQDETNTPITFRLIESAFASGSSALNDLCRRIADMVNVEVAAATQAERDRCGRIVSGFVFEGEDVGVSTLRSMWDRIREGE